MSSNRCQNLLRILEERERTDLKATELKNQLLAKFGNWVGACEWFSTMDSQYEIFPSKYIMMGDCDLVLELFYEQFPEMAQTRNIQFIIMGLNQALERVNFLLHKCSNPICVFVATEGFKCPSAVLRVYIRKMLPTQSDGYILDVQISAPNVLPKLWSSCSITLLGLPNPLVANFDETGFCSFSSFNSKVRYSFRLQ